MSLPADYHMHTRLCRHAVGDATDLAAHAVRLGIREIGFSEHNPMPRDDYDDWPILQTSFDEYIEQVNTARRDHPQLTIKTALEMDYIPGMEDWIRDLAARHPWDYLIGAVHYVSNTPAEPSVPPALAGGAARAASGLAPASLPTPS